MNFSRRQFLVGLSTVALPCFAIAQNHDQHGHMPFQPSSNEQENHGHMLGIGNGTTVGYKGQPQDVKQTIQIDMHDQNRFTPNKIDLKAGETVRFFIRNMGKIKHEFVIGTKQELLKHAVIMKQITHMTHDYPNIISLQPRQKGGVIWHFDKPGTYYFGCLEPGHFEGGMLGTLNVIN